MKYLDMVELMYDPELWSELLELNMLIFEFWKDLITL